MLPAVQVLPVVYCHWSRSTVENNPRKAVVGLNWPGVALPGSSGKLLGDEPIVLPAGCVRSVQLKSVLTHCYLIGVQQLQLVPGVEIGRLSPTCTVVSVRGFSNLVYKLLSDRPSPAVGQFQKVHAPDILVSAYFEFCLVTVGEQGRFAEVDYECHRADYGCWTGNRFATVRADGRLEQDSLVYLRTRCCPTAPTAPGRGSSQTRSVAFVTSVSPTRDGPSFKTATRRFSLSPTTAAFASASWSRLTSITLILSPERSTCRPVFRKEARHPRSSNSPATPSGRFAGIFATAGRTPTPSFRRARVTVSPLGRYSALSRRSRSRPTSSCSSPTVGPANLPTSHLTRFDTRSPTGLSRSTAVGSKMFSSAFATRTDERPTRFTAILFPGSRVDEIRTAGSLPIEHRIRKRLR